MNHKQFKVIPTTVVFEHDEVYDTYVNVDEKLRITNSTFTAKGFSKTRPFMHLSTHVFRSQ